MTMKEWIDQQIERNRKEANDGNNSETGTRTAYFSGKTWALIEVWEALTGERHPARGGGQ
ncbi:hypothetical protein GCM10007416_32320 [Kroppenstedtia guangzhouensis]|uniref:Uncharacterized protein n=1 Tax=Kroppenstedtia guangzhouensis TaxID=1274356 RepID=A0ABQ1H3P5_9BACL|nr:hypothetical protein [Kroppenstedtia guangzhouensis]GGA56635.1 hypothetical protein GCM10007416_32320 [Kroppenstedtia guangzhouensis]